MQETLTGVVRHVLTTAGGGLVAKGLVTASMLDQGVGAVITLVGVVWSILSKRKPQQ